MRKKGKQGGLEYILPVTKKNIIPRMRDEALSFDCEKFQNMHMEQSHPSP